jgi:hypothetical protein
MHLSSFFVFWHVLKSRMMEEMEGPRMPIVARFQYDILEE